MSLRDQASGWSTVWTPLLQAAIVRGTDVNYRLGLKHCLEWVDEEYQRPLLTIRQIDEALCEYAWWVYENWGG